MRPMALHCLGWVEHPSDRRLHKRGNRVQQLMAGELGHDSQRILHLHPAIGAYGLAGSGNWSVTIQNAWTGSSVATYDLDIVFDGICEGDCFIPSACNYNPFADLVNNDLCIFADDLYSPPGVYDCDGNCLLDFDGDGICNPWKFLGVRNRGLATTTHRPQTQPLLQIRVPTPRAMRLIVKATVCSLNSWRNPKTSRCLATTFQNLPGLGPARACRFGVLWIVPRELL